MTQSLPASEDPARIQEVLDGRWAGMRRDARENLSDPDFLPVYGETNADAEVRAAAEGDTAAEDSATDLAVAPAQ